MALRDSPFSDIKVPLAWTAGAAVAVCLVIGVVLLVLDRRETLGAEAFSAVKSAADAVQRPISGAAAAPVRWVQAGFDYVGDYAFAIGDNRRLKAENRKLRATYDQVIALQDVNERYRQLLGLKTDPPIDMVSGRAVTDARGPFANARLINVGREGGVLVGNPVMSENGLVGRVVGVTAGASRVLLLTDITSRTPVMLDRTNARAILTGDGGPNPKLAFLRSREAPRVGDRVLTSGDGGVIPRGLPVGVTVKGLDGAWRVELSADQTRIDFVRVLKFKDFSQLVSTEALSAPVMPSQMGGALPPAALAPPVTPTTPSAPIGAPPATTATTLPRPALPTVPPPATAPPRTAGPTAPAPAAKTAAPPPARAEPAERPAPPPVPFKATGR